MSSVTRLRLLSRSMLNVSCQKQKHRRFPLTLTESSMEFVGQPRPSEASNLLGVPGFSSLDTDEDEGDVVIGIRPKSSPLPRRKSSVSDEDSEPEPPPSGSRRVSFADAKGLSLVKVKEFDTWDVPKLPGYDLPEGKGADLEGYHLSPLTFSHPLSTPELFAKVLQQKAELETVELLPGTTILKGVVRVLNVSFDKSVYIRTTLDEWSTHFDLLAEYIPDSGDGVTDCFSFKLTLVPPFGERGARVEFCLRYETPLGTFWANNNNRNYVLFCHHRVKEEKDKPQRENVNKKSCLKTTSQNFPVEDVSFEPASSQENISPGESNAGLKVDAINKKIPDGQSEAPEERRQKLLMESKQNSSRRRRRKAARMTKVREYFAQRNGGPTDAGTPPEIKQATQEGVPGERPADVQPASEGNSRSSKFAFEALETCGETPHGDYSRSEEPETSDTAAFARGEGVTRIRGTPPRPADDSAELQNISQPVANAEDDSRDADSAAAAAASQASGFTFGTVVAPLYHQVSGRLGGESKSARDEENPESTGGFKPPSERRQTGCFVSIDTRRKSGNIRGNETDNWELNHESSDVALNNPSAEEEETATTVDNVLDNVENPAEFEKDSEQSLPKISQSPRALSDDTSRCLTLENVSPDADLSQPQIPADGVRPRGDAGKDDPTRDFLRRAAAEAVRSQPPEQTCSQTAGGGDGDLTRGEAHDTVEPFQSASLNEEKQSEVPDEPNQTGPLTKSSEPDRTDIMTPSETQGETCDVGGEIKITCDASEAVTKDVMRDRRRPAGVFERLGGERAPETTGRRETQAAVSNQDEDLDSADIKEVKNWEMMVEEEENDISTNEEEIELIDSKGEDTGAETKDATPREKEIAEDAAEEMGAAGVKKDELDNTGGLEDKEWTREEETEETAAPKDTELEDLQVRKSENTVRADKVAVEETKGPEEAELIKEEPFEEIQQVRAERTRVQDEERREQEEKMGEERENQEEEKDDNKEEQNSGPPEEIHVDEEGDMEVLDADSCTAVDGRGDEVGYFEERPDVTQNDVERSSSAPVSTVGDEDAREDQHARIQTDVPFKEDGFENRKDVTSDQTKVDNEHPAFSASEPEGDRPGHDSASAESDSDDEVALYMHCLRAAGASAQAQKDRSKEAALTVSKRPPASRSKPPPAPMPPITESVDEEQHGSGARESRSDAETPAAAAPPSASGFSRSVSWWKDTSSCSNIMKTLLYTTLVVVFLVVAYHYDFLACFLLYLVSVVWLCCHGEKQPVKSDNKAATEK